VLLKIQSETDVLATYYNKTLSTANKKYCTTSKVLLAGVKTVNNLLSKLYGNR